MTVDELIDARFASVAAAFNEQFENMYRDFNLTLEKQFRDVRRVELSFANTANILFGMVNDQKVRMQALINVLDRDGLNADRIEEEYEICKRELITSGEWKEHSVDQLFGKPVNPALNEDEPGLTT